MEITITKEFTLTTAKAQIKADFIKKLTDFLATEYGEDAVAMIRTGNASKTNEIGVIVGTGTGEDGESNPIVVTLNPTVKEFTNHKSDKKTYVPFDFYGASAEYNQYVNEKATKDAEKAAAKEAKIKRDKAAREEKANTENSDF